MKTGAQRLAMVAIAALLTGCGGENEGSGSPPPARPIVLVSGRDDHGLLVARTVGLRETPGGSGSPRERVVDGTLAAVVDTRGEWIRVRALEGRSSTGWVNDFYLRGTVHLAGGKPGCPVAARERPRADTTFRFPASAQVELLELARDGARVWVRVRSVKTREEAWVERRAIAELPLRGRKTTRCSDSD